MVGLAVPGHARGASSCGSIRSFLPARLYCAKRQIKIYSSQTMGNAAQAVGFDQNPILGKSRDCGAPKDRQPEFTSLNPHGPSEEVKGHALGDLDLGTDSDRSDVKLAVVQF